MGYTVSTVKKYIGSLSGGEEIPSLTEALEQLSAANVRQVIVQPTHLLYGYEYDKLKAEAASLEARFETLTVGRPLLADNRDIQRFAYHLSQDHPARAEGAAVFMGHGTEHFANAV